MSTRTEREIYSSPFHEINAKRKRELPTLTSSIPIADISGPSRHRSVLSRFSGVHGSTELDPSIQQARERVMNAERAETEADRALEAARLQVREALADVKRLEHEAAEDARRAKIKQYHAREVSKRGKQLGRKFHQQYSPLSFSISISIYVYTPYIHIKSYGDG